MNRKILTLLLILLLIIISLLCSCSGGGLSPIMFNDDDKKADARFEQVFKALQNKDKDSLKAMFSKQAIDESKNFDDNMDALFAFLNGKVESWEAADLPGAENYSYQGHKYKKVDSYYYVTIDQQKYFFLLLDWPVDTDHPDNVGLYLLLVVKEEDEAQIWKADRKIIFDGDKKISHAGIYLPIQ